MKLWSDFDFPAHPSSLSRRQQLHFLRFQFIFYQIFLFTLKSIHSSSEIRHFRERIVRVIREIDYKLQITREEFEIATWLLHKQEMKH